jgi:phosphatidylglycerol:prolipoprotein diacylglycerol transferase
MNNMRGPYFHHFDPVLVDLSGVYLWWYGLGFTLGFLQMLLFLKRNRPSLGLNDSEVYALMLFFVTGVLLGGRLIEVTFDEWPFYRSHPGLIPAYWLGGMATHGLLLGAAVSISLFAALYRKSLLSLADALVIPGALLLGLGRIGNFIDGQIVGSVTDVWWAVKFPDAEHFRHPVVLYDGAKNLLLIPYLLWIRKTNRTPGAVAARFIFWYAFLRIFIDLFRDYPTHRLALGTGQTLNIVMASIGAVLLLRSAIRRRRLSRSGAREEDPPQPAPSDSGRSSIYHRVGLAAILLFCLLIPSNWTQDIPERYGKRHPGLRYSFLYPHIDTRPPR